MRAPSILLLALLLAAPLHTPTAFAGSKTVTKTKSVTGKTKKTTKQSGVARDKKRASSAGPQRAVKPLRAAPKPSSKFNGADLLLKGLKKYGINFLPSNPGVTEATLAARGGNRIGNVLQENVAGFSAQGMHYGNPKKPAAVLAHGIVGLEAMASTLVHANQDAVPMVVLVGTAGVAEDAQKQIQNPTDQSIEMALRAKGAKGVYTVTSPEDLTIQLRKAVEMSQSGRRGVVGLIVPESVMAAAANPKTPIMPLARQTKVKPERRTVTTVTKKLRGAKQPVIIVGDEVAIDGGMDAVVELAELTGAKVYGSFEHHLSFPKDHPLFSGHTNTVYANQLPADLQEADVVITMGLTGQDVQSVFPGTKQPFNKKAYIVSVGQDPDAAPKSYAGTVRVAANTDSTARELVKSLRQGGAGRDKIVKERVARISNQNRSARTSMLQKADDARKSRKVHELDLFEALSGAIAGREDIVVYNSAISRGGLLEQVLQPKRPGSYFALRGGALGGGGPVAAGIALAHREQGKETTVIVVSGDGDFNYTPQNLMYLREHGLNVKQVILKDNTYNFFTGPGGALENMRASQGLTEAELGRPDSFDLARDRRGQRQINLDYVALAKAYGKIPAMRVKDRAQIAKAIDLMLQTDGPVLIELDLTEASAKKPRARTAQN